MKDPLVSIIIPTYNRAHLIGETLDSVIAQTYTNWECIVVDDGSKDHTDEVLNIYCIKDSRIKYFHRPKEHLPGGNGARNYGFKLSKGVYINWFDSDDILKNNLLKAKIDLFYNSKCDFVTCGFEMFNHKGEINKIIFQNQKDYLKSYFFDLVKLNSFNICWDRDVIKKNLWDEKIYKFQDLDFIFRVLSKDFYYGLNIEKSLIQVRTHSKSISANNNFKTNRSRLKVRQRIYRFSLENFETEYRQRLYHLLLFEYKNVLSNRAYLTFLYSLLNDRLIPVKIKITFLLFFTIHFFYKKGSVGFSQYLHNINKSS